jgi:hypothetical protein
MGAIKNITIQAGTTYPIVSAYEYEFLKEEKVVQERMGHCTIYLILQRPLTYFDHVQLVEGGLTFHITDNTQPPLECFLPFVTNEFCELNETTELEFGFYKKDRDEKPPFNDVGAIKIRKLDGEFVVWLSPQKFIYEVLCGNIEAEIKGDPLRFSDYHVHYIGQAFDQKIWRRLTGHEKLQKILTLEGPMSERADRAPLEISIAMINILGYDEAMLMGSYDFAIPHGVAPIIHKLDTEEQAERFAELWLDGKAPELTNEVEALLVNLFQPTYNKIKFERYPKIKRGTRSKGYTSASVVIERLPAILKTSHYQQNSII